MLQEQVMLQEQERKARIIARILDDIAASSSGPAEQVLEGECLKWYAKASTCRRRAEELEYPQYPPVSSNYSAPITGPDDDAYYADTGESVQ